MYKKIASKERHINNKSTPNIHPSHQKRNPANPRIYPWEATTPPQPTNLFVGSSWEVGRTKPPIMFHVEHPPFFNPSLLYL